MSMIWAALGFIRWPLAFSAVAVLVLTLWSASRVFRPHASADVNTKAWIDAVMFWGGFAAVAGVLGSLLGIILAAQSVEAQGEVVPTLLAGGIKIALLSSAFGIMILMLAALAWFVLRTRWRILFGRQMEVAA